METTQNKISIVVNGEATEVVCGANVVQLLESLGLHAGRVAIERNLQILPRGEWTSTKVKSGDRYEIVQFVGGG